MMGKEEPERQGLLRSGIQTPPTIVALTKRWLGPEGLLRAGSLTIRKGPSG